MCITSDDRSFLQSIDMLLHQQNTLCANFSCGHKASISGLVYPLLLESTEESIFVASIFYFAPCNGVFARTPAFDP
jgi:hypothetical protein